MTVLFSTLKVICRYGQQLLVTKPANIRGVFQATGANFSATPLWCGAYVDDVQKVKKLNKKLIELNDEDLIENQIKGWGGGGQKTNKTENCVSLTHAPTGIRVKVHSSRLLSDNKTIARARLRMKVDLHVKGDDSIISQEQMKKALKKQIQKLETRKTLESKAKMKETITKFDDVKY